MIKKIVSISFLAVILSLSNHFIVMAEVKEIEDITVLSLQNGNEPWSLGRSGGISVFLQHPSIINTSNLLVVSLVDGLGKSFFLCQSTELFCRYSVNQTMIDFFKDSSGPLKIKICDKARCDTQGSYSKFSVYLEKNVSFDGGILSRSHGDVYIYKKNNQEYRVPCFFNAEDILRELYVRGAISLTESRDQNNISIIKNIVVNTEGNISSLSAVGYLQTTYPNGISYCRLPQSYTETSPTPSGSVDVQNNVSNLRSVGVNETTGGIQLMWNLPTEVPVNESYRLSSYEIYLIEYDQNGIASSEKLQTTIAPTTSYVLSSLKRGVKYTVILRGKSSSRNIVTVDTLTDTFLKSENTSQTSSQLKENTLGLRVTSKNEATGGIQLMWNLPTEVPSSEAYRVNVFEVAYTEYDAQGRALSEIFKTRISPTNYYSFSPLKKDTKYTITLKGKSSTGNIVTVDTLTDTFLTTFTPRTTNPTPAPWSETKPPVTTLPPVTDLSPVADSSRLVLQVTQRNILVRGFVESVEGDKLRVRTFGGYWNVKISPSTTYVPASNGRPRISVGDFIGARGILSSTESYTFTADAFRNRTLNP